MMREVHHIPPAPRRVRLRPLLAHRWPLLAVGGALVVLGCLFAWAMFLHEGGKFSMAPRLDQGPTRRVQGTVKAVAPPMELERQAWQHVGYDFEWRGVSLSGASFTRADLLRVGDTVDIEVLEAEPNISRIAGSMLHVDRIWLHARFWIGAMVVPGALVLLGWLAGLFQLRQVLVHGDVSVGRVLAIRPVRFVLPEMLRVAYEFRDHRATARKNSHWVRVHGELGARLVQQMQTGLLQSMPVLHDRRLPHWNRMLLPQDFLPMTTKDAQPANGTA